MAMDTCVESWRERRPGHIQMDEVDEGIAGSPARAKPRPAVLSQQVHKRLRLRDLYMKLSDITEID